MRAGPFSPITGNRVPENGRKNKRGRCLAQHLAAKGNQLRRYILRYPEIVEPDNETCAFYREKLHCRVYLQCLLPLGVLELSRCRGLFLK